MRSAFLKERHDGHCRKMCDNEKDGKDCEDGRMHDYKNGQSEYDWKEGSQRCKRLLLKAKGRTTSMKSGWCSKDTDSNK